MRLPPVIGIAGRARTGKDTTANFLIAEYGGYRYSFADPLRAMLKAGLGIDMADPYWAKNKEVEIAALGKSPRQLMQTLGTEWGRDMIHPEIWLTLATDKLRMHGRGMVIPDLRFENEVQWVRKYGGVIIHLSRDDAPEIAPHSSESGLIPGPTDIHLFNNAGLDDLQHAISRLFHG